MEQRNSLAHHVGAHQGTVGIVVLKERNECCGDRRNLRGRHVHKVDLVGSDYREVRLVARLDFVADELAVLVEGCVTLCYGGLLLVFGGVVHYMVVVEVHDTVLHLAVGGFDEAKVIDFRIYTKRRYKSDVRSFRCLNRAEATIVRVVDVSYLESRTVTAQAAGAEGRHTTLVGNLRERVLLVHELRERIGTEIGVDDTGNRFGVDKVGRRKDLGITHVHTLADGARHTCETDTELVVELFAYGTYTTVGEVVDIIDFGIGVDELHQVFDNLNHVLLGERARLHRNGHIEFAVDAVASHFAKVVSLVGEEEVLDDLACGDIIGRLCVAELAIDIQHRLLLGVRRVFLEGVEDDRILSLVRLLFVQEDGLGTRLENGVAQLGRQHRLAFDDNLVTLDGDHFARVLIDEILGPSLEHVTRQGTTHHSIQIVARALYLFCQSETIKDVLVALETDGTE